MKWLKTDRPAKFLKRPSSLFAKIFLWFCVYILTVFVVGIYISATSVGFSSSSRIVRKISKQALLLYGETLVERYEKGGKDSLDRALRRVESNGNLNLYFFDGQGNEILGRSPAGLSREQVKNLLLRQKGNGFIGSEKIHRKIYLNRGIIGESGNQYIVLAEPVHNFLGKIMTKYTISRLIIFLIAAGCFSYLLSRYLTNPIRALQTATQRLAKGNLSTRIGLQKGRRRDELVDLAGDFDLMAEKIEILEDVRRQFLSDISHEFRSPLTRLNIAVEMARKKNHWDISDYLDRIDLESESLKNIIDRILATTRKRNLVEADHPVSIDLNGLLEEILGDANFEAQSRKCAIEIIANANLELTGIRHLIKNALENVIYNAIHYTKEGTRVEISLKSEDRSGHPFCIVTVRDHGNGVPENELRKIFQPFYRTDDSRDRRSGGTGLGLAITDRAVRYHHGTVTASNAAGGGLIVQMALPVSGLEPEGDI
jgi:two-component system sensor histidine kinase CpxA